MDSNSGTRMLRLWGRFRSTDHFVNAIRKRGEINVRTCGLSYCVHP